MQTAPGDGSTPYVERQGLVDTMMLRISQMSIPQSNADAEIRQAERNVPLSSAPNAQNTIHGNWRLRPHHAPARGALRTEAPWCSLPGPPLWRPRVDPKSAFIKRFGDLIALLRVDPGNDAAQDLALAAAVAAVEDEPVEVEAGIEWTVIPDELTLKGRLLARQVEQSASRRGPRSRSCSRWPERCRTISSPSPPPRTSKSRWSSCSPRRPAPSGRRRAADRRRGSAAARDRAPDLGGAPPPRTGPLPRDRAPAELRPPGHRRAAPVSDSGTAGRDRAPARGLVRSARALAWEAVLAAAVALVRLIPQVPAGSGAPSGSRSGAPFRAARSSALVDLAEREASVRERRRRRCCGGSGSTRRRSCSIGWCRARRCGVRGFYYDVLGGMPGVYPLVTPLLASRRPHEVRHGAALLGRLGQPAGIASWCRC